MALIVGSPLPHLTEKHISGGAPLPPLIAVLSVLYPPPPLSSMMMRFSTPSHSSIVLGALCCLLSLWFSAFRCCLHLHPPWWYILSTKECLFLIFLAKVCWSFTIRNIITLSNFVERFCYINIGNILPFYYCLTKMRKSHQKFFYPFVTHESISCPPCPKIDLQNLELVKWEHTCHHICRFPHIFLLLKMYPNTVQMSGSMAELKGENVCCREKLRPEA